MPIVLDRLLSKMRKEVSDMDWENVDVGEPE